MITPTADDTTESSYASDEPLTDNAIEFDALSNTGSVRCSHGPPRIGRGAEIVALAMSHERQLRSRLQRLLGSHPDVSDLLQEVYLHLLLAGNERSESIQCVISYANTVARNKAFDWIRHHRLVTSQYPIIDIDTVDVVSEAMQPDELISAEEDLSLLCQAIDSLPERCREVFVLRKIHGLSQKHISRTLGISVNTIEQHITRASRHLRQTLRHDGSPHAILRVIQKRAKRGEQRKVG